ncbi:tryptophan--tRNA ligase, mitochondrial [[Candida] railenensis]|uniref:Tryptophan--tRNA ligase, mitochondrial n=1 Tax=[Candida] railenensis TaxID=45579 RepID=A0A9P0QN61_9ASCO|nr:tryptophan--tRNA ligase, mitochondrial [[Candida] railenensis]
MIRTSLRLYSSASVQITTIPKFAQRSTIFSLVQPTGKIHLGNYLGAIRNWKDISESSENEQENTFIFGLADLHALTLPNEASVLKRNRYEAIASIIAAGVDPEKCILYHQSSVPEHAELNWVLTCLTSMGLLSRMTTWKSKVFDSDNAAFGSSEQNMKAGLFCYPVLQSADILLYKSTHVPVGDDQSQHLELSRSLASSFNKQFKSDFFPLPTTLLTPTNKVLSLRNPTKKMSKSDLDQNSCIYINESPEVIQKKVRKATTDSIQGKITFDEVNRPGVSNLINIIAGLKRNSIDQTVEELSWITNHKELKDYICELLDTEFRDTRQYFEELTRNTTYLDKVCRLGSEKAREIASKNMREVKRLTGLD